MPSFISQMPVSNHMGTEGNNTNTSRMSEFGVLEQYLGFRIGDGANVNRSPLFNSTSATNPAVSFDVSGTINRNLAPSNTSLSTAAPGSQILPLQSNLVSAAGAHPENWGESNMADSGSRTDTSTDLDGDDRNQRTLRRLAQNREAARKSRLRKKAYVQQLENSRLKLSQLEQDLQRARQQGKYISNMADQSNGAGASDAAVLQGH